MRHRDDDDTQPSSKKRSKCKYRRPLSVVLILTVASFQLADAVNTTPPSTVPLWKRMFPRLGNTALLGGGDGRTGGSHLPGRSGPAQKRSKSVIVGDGPASITVPVSSASSSSSSLGSDGENGAIGTSTMNDGTNGDGDGIDDRPTNSIQVSNQERQTVPPGTTTTTPTNTNNPLDEEGDGRQPSSPSRRQSRPPRSTQNYDPLASFGYNDHRRRSRNRVLSTIAISDDNARRTASILLSGAQFGIGITDWIKFKMWMDSQRMLWPNILDFCPVPHLFGH